MHLHSIERTESTEREEHIFWLWSAWKDLYEQNLLLLLLFISFIIHQNSVMIPWGWLNLNLYWVYSLISMDSWSWYWWSIISYINIIERHTFAIVMMHVAASFHAMDPQKIPCSSKAIFYICHHHRSVYFQTTDSVEFSWKCW